MSKAGRFRAALVIGAVLFLSWTSAGWSGAPASPVDDVMSAAEAGECIIVAEHRTWVPTPAPQPRPDPETYDSRLYRADWARARRWGS